MKLKIAQVVGLNTDQKAAQVVSSVREDNTFLAVLQITCDDAFTKGRQALSELEDFYFESEGNIGEKLNATFKKAEEAFVGTEYDLCLAAVSGKVLYLIFKGEVEAYLKRGGRLSSLVSVGASSQLISGFLNPEDKLLFATKSLTHFLGSDLEKSLNLQVEVFEEEVGSKIGTTDLEEKSLAALVVEIQEEMQEDEAQIPQLPEEETISGPGYQYETQKPALFKALPAKLISIIRQIPGYLPKSGRGKLVTAAILIAIVLGGAAFQYKAGLDKKIQANFASAIQEAKDNFNAAKSLKALSPNDAKSKLELAKEKINYALTLKPKSSEAKDFKKQLEDESPSILQQSAVSDFPEFLDLDLIKENFRASQMSLSGNKLLVLDPGVKTLVLIDLDKKSNQILAGSEKLGDASLASINGGIAFVYSKDKGILKIDTTNSKITTVSKADKEWGEIKDIYGFSGNVYAIDSGNNQIWKYVPAAEGYSDKREYFSKDTKAELASVIRLQIESSVYTLKTDGEILRFTKGVKDSFSYSGLPSNVKEPKNIFTSSDTENLYLLDSGNSRLLVLTKTGVFKSEVTGSKFATASDLVVDEVGKKVYLLEGGKIYTVDLK